MDKFQPKPVGGVTTFKMPAMGQPTHRRKDVNMPKHFGCKIEYDDEEDYFAMGKKLWVKKLRGKTMDKKTIS